jgi:bifunctional DNA-binding transcriptional regulator/antitoxin component of YhaV-PrlF toxin-antitoxin module
VEANHLDGSMIANHVVRIMATAQIAAGGQVVLPPDVAGKLRLRDGRPASLLQAEVREDGVLLRPLEPRDIPVDTLRKWIAEGDLEMEEFRKRTA